MSGTVVILGWVALWVAIGILLQRHPRGE